MLILLKIFLYLHYYYYFSDNVMLCNSVLIIINVYVMPCYVICDCLYKCMLLHIFIQSVSRLKPYDKILISIAGSFVVVAFACLSVTRVELCLPSLAAISPGLDRVELKWHPYISHTSLRQCGHCPVI